MKKNIKRVLSFILVGTLTLSAFIVNAGNEDRTGQSGAAELLINPWGSWNWLGKCRCCEFSRR